jgi:hypothetical protein
MQTPLTRALATPALSTLTMAQWLPGDAAPGSLGEAPLRHRPTRR